MPVGAPKNENISGGGALPHWPPLVAPLQRSVYILKSHNTINLVTLLVICKLEK